MSAVGGVGVVANGATETGDFTVGGNGVSATGGGGGGPSEGVGGIGVFAQGGNGLGNGNGGIGLYAQGGSSPNFGGDGFYIVRGSGGIANGKAGNFQGDVFIGGNLEVTGSILAGTKDFRIDHPLDPENKYLAHASVESSEMMNIYSGNVTTDTQGNATVRLPEWFEVLNADFRYQLTVIGQIAQAVVAHKIEDNRFEIRTSAPNVEVSWQVTGVRQDAYAKANPLVVEEKKDARLRGFYIHPELYGAPPEKQIEWARHPQQMKHLQQTRERAQQSAKLAPAKTR